MRIAIAQLAASTDPEVNLHLVCDQIRRASVEGAELVVFPEAMSCSFARPRIEAAESLDGSWAGAVRREASAANLIVVVGMFTPGRTAGKVRNTLLVTGPGVEAHYDKLHLFDAYGYAESDQIEPGDEAVMVDIGGVAVGLATCYDIRFPELFTDLARRGADVILVPSSWAAGEGKVDQWRSLAVARALDSTSYIVAVGQAEPEPTRDASEGVRKPTGVGHSMVVGPLGQVLLELDAGPQLEVIDLDIAAVAQARAALPVLTNRRYESRLVVSE